MADEIDKACESEEMYRAAHLSHRKKTTSAVATGGCLNCLAEGLSPGQRWCDADCRDDYEARENLLEGE